MDDTEIQLLDSLENNHWWYQIRKRILVNEVISFGHSLSILDLGSASGGNSMRLLEMGHSVTSVEYSDLGVSIQRRKGIPVLQADARSLPFKNNTFDLVVCLDVLEHIVEEEQVVSEIYRVLKPSGKFIISVPEGKKLWSSHDVAVSHVKRYERDELAFLAESSGLVVSKMYSRNVFVKPIAMFTRRFTRGSDLKSVPWLLNKIIFGFAYIENVIGTFGLRGMTIWMIGRKY